MLRAALCTSVVLLSFVIVWLALACLLSPVLRATCRTRIAFGIVHFRLVCTTGFAVLNGEGYPLHEGGFWYRLLPFGVYYQSLLLSMGRVACWLSIVFVVVTIVWFVLPDLPSLMCRVACWSSLVFCRRLLPSLVCA